MSALIIVGGVHGVGKTTLLSTIVAECRTSTAFFDPGPLFEEHLWRKKDKTPEEVEDMAVSELVRRCRESRVVLSSWHWGVWTPYGYAPQISPERWRLLLAEAKPDRLYLVTVTASPERILERRIRDYAKHPRKRSLEAIKEELVQSDEYYRAFLRIGHEYADSGTAILVPAKVDNTGLDAAVYRLKTLYTQAHETARTPE